MLRKALPDEHLHLLMYFYNLKTACFSKVQYLTTLSYIVFSIKVAIHPILGTIFCTVSIQFIYLKPTVI